MLTFRKAFVRGSALLAFAALLCAVPMFASETSAAPSVPKKQTARAPVSSDLPVFQGVGRKDGKLETGFEKEKHDYRHALTEHKKDSGIEFGEDVQAVIDKAADLLESLDEKTLEAVSHPLSALGIEAEDAKIRPTGSGVGLNVSINLEKKKKDAASADTQPGDRDKRKEVYDLILPGRDASKPAQD